VPTYDVHQHLWPEQLVEALRRRKRPPRLEGSRLELGEGSFELDVGVHGLARRLAELDLNGIEVAVVSLQPTLAEPLDGELTHAYHEGIRAVAAEAGGRIVPLAAAAAFDGFAGACVSARQLLELDSVASLLDDLERRGQFLFVHPGPAPPRPEAPEWWAPGVHYPGQMQEAYAAWLAAGAERWPRLPVVFAILAGGAPFQLERMGARGLDVRTALGAEVYLDTASYGRRALELCLATYGVGRLVYGSDAPVIDPRSTLSEVRSFGEAVTAAICEENPARLLQ
jgi:6-methylsalicylate decarboxylase